MQQKVRNPKYFKTLKANNSFDARRFLEKEIPSKSNIFNKSFTYKIKNAKIKIEVDLFQNIDNKVNIFLISDSTTVLKSSLHILSLWYYVLLNQGIKVNKSYIWHINKKYIRNDDDIIIDELLKIVDVSREVVYRFIKVDEKISQITKLLNQKDEIYKDISKECYKFSPCPLIDKCMSHIPKESVFLISRLPKKEKFSLYKKNIISYESLSKQKGFTQIQYMQINKEKKLNKEKIKEFLDDLKYPLYYIDFEAYQEPIPRFHNTRSYEQVAFLYSIHIEQENGDISHHEHIVIDGNPKEELAKSIVKCINSEGTYIAYNVDFEKYALRKLSFYDEELEEITSSIIFKDLMSIFKNHYYYLPAMNGSHSIKNVLRAIFPDDENYNSLKVQSGYEAMNSYLDMLNENKNKKEISHNLKKYCEMDTFAMVKIIRHLRSIVS